MPKAILLACSVWWLLTFVVQWLSAWKGRKPSRPGQSIRHEAADFSVVAPMVGAVDASPGYVDALNLLARDGVEILICVEREEDEAVALVRRLWPDAPILFGLETRFTAKVNNVEKGFRAASRPVVALCDAGALLTVEQLKGAAAALSSTTGMVLALKAAEEPASFAAEIERAYIDGHGARFLFAADWLGIPVASGGVTILERETLERIGYGAGFTRYIADDFSVTESVRALGLKTQLSDVMPKLPLGARRWSDVWGRQVRWARTRLRLPVWLLVMWEPLIGLAVSLAALVAAMVLAGIEPELVVAAAVLNILLWLGAEKWFMAGRGLGYGPRAALASLVREVLAPALMVTALSGRSMKWRKGDLGDSWRKRDMMKAEIAEANAAKVDMAAIETTVKTNATPGDVATVALPDSFDSVSATRFERDLTNQMMPGARIIVDGHAVTYMSAAGVRTLASILHRAAERQAELVFCRFSTVAVDCLVVSGFSDLFEVTESTEEALSRLNEPTESLGDERLHRPVGTG